TGVPNGHVLNQAGIARITGLAAILPPGATTWGAGNILLGGAGSDLIEGRGGDDIIDGDRWLNVQLTVVNQPTLRFDSLHQMKAMVFAGQISPSDIRFVRELVTFDGAGNVDVALFSGPRGNYTVTPGAGFV